VPRDAQSSAAALSERHGRGRAAPHAECTQSIGDYGVIGDCRCAALVSKDGSIDWLCLPRFSSPALFGALLDSEHGGRYRIRPTVPFEVSRRYLPLTNVLETTWRTAHGTVRLLDSMPLPSDADLEPMRAVLRRLEGIEGEVPVRLEIHPRPDYGRRRAVLEPRARGAWAWTWGSEWLQLDADFPLREFASGVVGECVVTAGQQLWASLAYSQGVPGIVHATGSAQQRLERTISWWQQWASRAKYEGPHRDAVIRGALTLKLLAYAPSGAVVAAPTASLPEAVGADRNWDYRYCWLRDAAFTMRAFTGLGYLDEARAFLDWMLHATRLTWPRLNVLYDEYGRTELREIQLPHWRGFCDSRPVRIGNEARLQLQLDVYGAVCLAAREFANAADDLHGDQVRLLRGFAQSAGRLWQEPDSGIWEIRGEVRHYTFSKVMCWAALDVLVDLASRGMLKLPAGIDDARTALRQVIESRGYQDSIGSYATVLGGEAVDASLLLMSCIGYCDPGSERMRGTFARVHERLARNGLLFRYEHGFDGFSAPEGAFGICCFWAIDNLAGRGDIDEATRSFEHVLGFANDLGLMSEEIDADSGALLGNFPQAYTHVGVINAALALARAGA
jgi:GH15 family glucan-1,4-alpha-glucosidase